MSAELLQAGYDLRQPSEAYSVEIWRRVIEVVRRHVVPSLDPAAGARELGRRFVAGFATTTIGSVFRRVAPLFGVDRTLLSVPRYLYLIRRTMRVTMQAEGVGRYRLIAFDSGPNAEFVAGCMLGLLELFSIQGRTQVVAETPSSFEVEITWLAPSHER